MIAAFSKSVYRSPLPVGIYSGVWSGFTVVVTREDHSIVSFEITDHQRATVDCTVWVKTNNVAYVKAK